MTPEDEEWRAVVGYEGIYEVSSHGRVRSVDRVYRDKRGYRRQFPGHVLSGGHNRFTGYRTVVLANRGSKSTRTIHRLVLEAFIGPAPDPKMVCCHNDGNKLNNRIENLRWDTETNNQLDRNKHGKSFACRTHCKHGHEYTPENTTYYPSAPRARVCLTCMKIHNSRKSLRRAGIDARVDNVA